MFLSPIKLLILVAVGYILWKLFAGDRKKKEVERKKDEKTMAASGQMVKDPICGTYVPKNSDIRVRDGEVTYNFCSYECRDRFVKQIEEGQQKDLES